VDADDVMFDFMCGRLPPAVPATESKTVEAAQKLHEGSRVRVAAPGVARVVVEQAVEGDLAVVVQHCMQNSRAQHAAVGDGSGEGGATVAEDKNSFELPFGCVDAVAALLVAEEAVRIGELPPCDEQEEEGGEEEEEDREVGQGVNILEVVGTLLQAGVLVHA
jgi:hypothetical protein